MAPPRDPESTRIIISQLLSLFVLLSLTTLPIVKAVGINWGTAASHLLPPQKVVKLLKANRVAKVKVSDADPAVLQSLSGSNIRVTVGIPNSMLRGLNSSLKAAESWVHDNLTRFLSDRASRVLIEYVAVGDELFLESSGEQFYPFVVGAAANIQTAISKANLAERVKVVAPCSFDAFVWESGLPSKVVFRSDINRTMIELLTYLNKHQAPFFVAISPFRSYRENKNVSLDFALFRERARAQNDSRRTYKNSFDLSYDMVASALSNAGFPQMSIVISQIGWPTDGAPNATSSLAQEFMKGLTDHLHSGSAKSSKRQDMPIEVYISSLLDEDKQSASTGDFERHWGVFTFDGQAKYQVDLGQGSRKLVNAQDVKYLSTKWCVVNNNKDLSNATALASEACSSADCTAMALGGSCYNLSWPGNISYAFNTYYQQHDQNADSCKFAGLGLITTVDPSLAACRFFVGLKASSSTSLDNSLQFCWIILSLLSMLFWLLNERW